MTGLFDGFVVPRHRASTRAPVLRAAVVVAVLAACAWADEVELVNGKRYQGLVLQRTPRVVTFKIVLPSGGTVETEFPVSSIKSLVVDGKEPVARPPAKPAGPAGQPAEPSAPKAAPPTPAKPAGDRRSRAEVEAIIQKVGKTPPQWWGSVSPDHPSTLDLAGTNPAKGWQPQRNMGAYFISVVNPNPDRWKPAVKLLHHVLEVRKNDPDKLREAVAMLARSYQRFLKDTPRAAFWWRKAIAMGQRTPLDNVTGLAECYFQLGGKSMAVTLLKKYGLDRTAHPATVKLWAELGEDRLALRLAEGMARQRAADGYLAAGNVCRFLGRHKQAIDYYSKVLAAGGHNPTRQRAEDAIEALRLYQAVDLARVPDGTYTDTAQGYRGPVEVAVEVKGGRIVSARVARHKEDMPLTSLTDIPARTVARQGLDRIDAVTGATISSEAVMNAAAKALGGAAK